MKAEGQVFVFLHSLQVSTQTYTPWECTHSCYSVINKKNVLYRLHSLTSKGGFHKKKSE